MHLMTFILAFQLPFLTFSIAKPSHQLKRFSGVAVSCLLHEDKMGMGLVAIVVRQIPQRRCSICKNDKYRRKTDLGSAEIKLCVRHKNGNEAGGPLARRCKLPRDSDAYVPGSRGT